MKKKLVRTRLPIIKTTEHFHFCMIIPGGPGTHCGTHPHPSRGPGLGWRSIWNVSSSLLLPLKSSDKWVWVEMKFGDGLFCLSGTKYHEWGLKQRKFLAGQF